MDADRFDALARTLTPGSRRSFLGTLSAVAGSALAPLLARDDAAAHDLKKKCKKLKGEKKKKCLKKAKAHNATHTVQASPPPCIGSCAGKLCGDDGCGRPCGVPCTGGRTCENGSCICKPRGAECTLGADNGCCSGECFGFCQSEARSCFSNTDCPDPCIGGTCN